MRGNYCHNICFRGKGFASWLWCRLGSLMEHLVREDWVNYFFSQFYSNLPIKKNY